VLLLSVLYVPHGSRVGRGPWKGRRISCLYRSVEMGARLLMKYVVVVVWPLRALCA